MDATLQHLIDIARGHKITPEEHVEQVRSFTYGNTHFENERITRADVAEAVAHIEASEHSFIKAQAK